METIGFIGSLAGFLLYVIAPLALFLNAKIGTRFTALLGVIISSAGLVGAAWSTEIWHLFLTYSVLFGVGASLSTHPSFLLVGEYFPRNNKYHIAATSMEAIGGALGHVIIQPLSEIFIQHYGWSTTFLIFGVTEFIVGTVTCATFRPCSTSGNTETTALLDDSPEENSPIESTELSPVDKTTKDANTFSSESEKHVINENHDNVDDKQMTPGTLPFNGYSILMLFVVLWLIGCFSTSLAYYAHSIVIVKYMEKSLNIDSWRGALTIVWLGIGEIITRLVTCIFGDRIKGRLFWLYVFCNIALVLDNVAGLSGRDFMHMSIFTSVMGLAAGPMWAAWYGACGDVLFGQHIPLLFTLTRSMNGIGLGLGPLIAGVIYESTGSYRNVFFLNCGLYGAAAIFFLLLIILQRHLYPDYTYGGEYFNLAVKSDRKNNNAGTSNNTDDNSRPHIQMDPVLTLSSKKSPYEKLE
ncbi:unnamed protein product [Owenia fusiformis]|uniref:Uncharacterized protein n=1 Tax=Owenia fusiformis TaxID=6347 RepID=A0A8J1UK73_OWEFU|nr:unnamed protein product [Owenia fusiformis]